jgi:hypothetical protein
VDHRRAAEQLAPVASTGSGAPASGASLRRRDWFWRSERWGGSMSMAVESGGAMSMGIERWR